MFILGMTSCKKDPKPEPLSADFENGILCLNEGLFQQNNATLSFYSKDSLKTTSNIFSSINGRGLGDTANDMIFYFYLGKPYIAIAVDVSSQVEILDALTLKSVKQIPIFNGTTAREPRALTYYNNFLYSINFDGTVSQIDLSNNTIIKTIQCGQNPDDAEIVNDKLYVVNSGGLNYPIYDSTITVIDLTSNSVSTTFQTAINCSGIIKDTENELYVISRGDYNSIQPKLLKINPSTNQVSDSYAIELTAMTFYNDFIYLYNQTDQGIHKFNTITDTYDSNVLIDCSGFQNLYSLEIDANSGLIYVSDANGYTVSSTVKCYDLNGNFKYEFTSGLNTRKLLFR